MANVLCLTCISTCCFFCIGKRIEPDVAWGMALKNNIILSLVVVRTEEPLIAPAMRNLDLCVSGIPQRDIDTHTDSFH